ncbi:MAG: LysR family transcriptional regulator, partial [Victivallales bacterium]
MNFIQLEYFRKVVECGSVTQASKDLFITQPAVSKQIRLLEEELGCE